jgi:hypothetical protein
MYNTTPGAIMDMNNLSDNNLSIGQKLIVAKSESATTVTKNVDASSSSMLPAAAVGTEKQAKTSSTSTTTAAVATEQVSSSTKTEPQDAYTDITKVVEHGLAQVIEDGTETRKYLALHRTAPIGTIMQIRNEMNDQIVFVRVVGTIQSTGDNDKILVKISKKAFDRLGAVDNRFPVELSYIP